MSEIISYSVQSYKRSIDFSSNFLLIGNNIDGRADVDMVNFNNFEELKSNLPKILTKLESFGEWDIKLYQVKKLFKIIKKYGYYKVPNRGRLIFEHSYMDYHIKSVQFNEHKMEIIGSSMDIIENWDAKSDEDFLNYEIDIEVKTIFFKSIERKA